MSDDDLKVWCSPEGLAAKVGYGRSTIMREIEAGRIKTQKTPRGHHRIHVSEQRRYIAELKKSGNNA